MGGSNCEKLGAAVIFQKHSPPYSLFHKQPVGDHYQSPLNDSVGLSNKSARSSPVLTRFGVKGKI
jgi:hypothetical protein